MTIATGSQALASDFAVMARITSGTYAGNDTVNRAIPHGLGVTPKIVFISDTQAGIFCWFRIFGGLAQILYFRILVATAGKYAVTIPNATNFYVGNAASYTYSANETDSGTYYWVAIG